MNQSAKLLQISPLKIPQLSANLSKRMNYTLDQLLQVGKSYRSGKKFKCGHCGVEQDADVNAAKNIAALGRAVTSPESPGITCLLVGQLPFLDRSELG